MDLSILIPAAGASSRMRGEDKLLQEVEGEPVLRRTARIARATGQSVTVTLPIGGPFAPARQAALNGIDVRILPLADCHEGMAASLRAGASEIGAAEGLMVVLPDMPEISIEDLERMIAAFARHPTRPLRAATEDGRTLGHPVVLPRRLMQALSVLTGDTGARPVLKGEDPLALPLPGRRAVIDLDTPEDWANWRAAH